MTAEVLTIKTQAQFNEAVKLAAELLRAGQLVALPTETVYGLAANAWDVEAVRRIFEAKGRPAENPIIVHVASLELARSCVSAWPAAADRLAAAFWPGPLTLVLPRSEEIPSLVTASGATVGVRWPSHPFIQAVIQACGFPLAAPSANLSTELSPTAAEHVRKSLGAKISLIIDGGPADVGIESSVLDLTSTPPRLLRPGMISADSLQAVLGEGAVEIGGAPEAIARSPGQLLRHYSPEARLEVLRWRDEADLAAQVSAFGLAREKIHLVTHSHVPLREQFGRVAFIPPNAEAFARALYAELHRSDEAGAELIIVEAPPPAESWRGIADRLRRAAYSQR
ncbi:MAG TPA: L-threonylcarbamoyladenylate synthase [Verrucomicrobiae bacterium]|jgi:L-threonylcarbamoyladenylate synthase|nr:L-threonylcarbamoyladenylate synthase [Verrucomicrobiae bacterium]